jgi:hypothetical protein
VNAPTPATAIIDGALCHLTRHGTPSAVHAPLATAIVEFLPGAMCYFVREHPLGLLPGIANLYCLDADLHLLWMAEWPSSDDPCVAIDGEDNGVLFALSASGALVRLDSATGRLLRRAAPRAPPRFCFTATHRPRPAGPPPAPLVRSHR